MNQKTKYITGIVLSVLVICALTIPAFALTESDVQSQVSASGKEGVAGNLFIWFLCAVAFLKISQKIDSFMQGLGINVGHTGGSMLAEAMLAARSIAAARGVAGRGRGGNAGRAGSTGGSGGDSNTFLQGGLAGVANRSFYNGAYRNATGTGSGGVGGMAFRASMTKGGDIANNVISRIATGGAGFGDVMSGNMAADALKSYMGYTALGEGAADIPNFSNVEIGGGHITGTETSEEEPDGRAFAMYCAAKNQDYTSISLKDMEDVIRKAKDALYTFTSTEEPRTTTVTDTTVDQKTGKVTVTETEVTEIWKIYTIVYNGEAYFEDKIFALSDEQKGLAENYAQNLSVFLGDGMIQGLLPAESAGLVSLGDIRFSDGATQVVYYNQLDKRYASMPYGTDDIGTYGCGPTCMAMVVSSLTSETVDPVEMARWAYENGYWCSRSGSYHSLIPGAAKAWGLPVQGCGKTEGQRIVDALSQGKLVVAIMLKGHFTSSGHFIVLRGVENGKILVADPANYTRSQQAWDLAIILNEASGRAGAGGPFWIIG